MKLVKSFLHYVFTHNYFYVSLYALTAIVAYQCVMLGMLLQDIFPKEMALRLFEPVLTLKLLKIMFFVHGCVGLSAVIDDYIFDAVIKKFLQSVFFIISVKLLLILVMNEFAC